MLNAVASILVKLARNQRGEFSLGGILVALVMVAVIATGVVAIWPTFVATDTTIQALTQTDSGTSFLQSIWPVTLLVGGAGIGVGVIIGLLHKFGLIGGNN